MSEVEATISRTKNHSSLIGHWITDSHIPLADEEPHLIRNYYKSTEVKDPKDAKENKDMKEAKEKEGKKIVHNVITLTEKARILVRDLDPSVGRANPERTRLHAHQVQEPGDHGRAGQTLQVHHPPEHRVRARKERTPS